MNAKQGLSTVLAALLLVAAVGCNQSLAVPGDGETTESRGETTTSSVSITEGTESTGTTETTETTESVAETSASSTETTGTTDTTKVTGTTTAKTGKTSNGFQTGQSTTKSTAKSTTKSTAKSTTNGGFSSGGETFYMLSDIKTDTTMDATALTEGVAKYTQDLFYLQKSGLHDSYGGNWLPNNGGLATVADGGLIFKTEKGSPFVAKIQNKNATVKYFASPDGKNWQELTVKSEASTPVGFVYYYVKSIGEKHQYVKMDVSDTKSWDRYTRIYEIRFNKAADFGKGFYELKDLKADTVLDTATLVTGVVKGTGDLSYLKSHGLHSNTGSHFRENNGALTALTDCEMVFKVAKNSCFAAEVQNIGGTTVKFYASSTATGGWEELRMRSEKGTYGVQYYVDAIGAKRQYVKIEVTGVQGWEKFIRLFEMRFNKAK